MDQTLLMQLFILLNAIVLGVIATLAVQFARAHFHHKKTVSEPPQERPQETVKFDPEVKRQILRDAEANFRHVLDKSVVSLENDLINTTAKLRSQLEQFGKNTEAEETQQYQQTLDELHNQARSILGSAQESIAAHQTDLTEKLNIRQTELENDLIDKITELEQELVSRQAQLQTELNERQAELEARLAKHHAELRTGFNERQEKIEAELNRHQTELESALKERETSLAKVQTELDQTFTQRKKELEEALSQEMVKKRAFLTAQLETKLSDAVSSFLLEALQHNIDLGAQAPYLTTLLAEHKEELIAGVTTND